MSVSFFPCAICKVSLCDCGDYIRCNCCNEKFCESCHKGYYNNEGEDLDYYKENQQEEYKKCCPICSLETILDNQLVEFFLSKKNLTRKKAEKLYRKENEKGLPKIKKKKENNN